jgi:hypothetical protein
MGWLLLTLPSLTSQGSVVAQHTSVVQLTALLALAGALVSLVLHRHTPVAPARRNL